MSKTRKNRAGHTTASFLLPLLLLLCCTAGCGKGQPAEPQNAAVSSSESSVGPASSPYDEARFPTMPEGDFLDLTQGSSIVAYTWLSAISMDPGGYVGKTIRMKGSFASYTDPDSQKSYYACMLYDASACCAQGLNFLPADPAAPLPAQDEKITVEGVFSTYEDEGRTCYRLADVVFL